MYKFDFFNLGKFCIVANVSDITATDLGHNFKIVSMDCTYDGAQVGTVSSSFQHFAEWLGLYGLDVFLAVAEELEMQEHAMMDFNQMPLDEAANY